MITGQVLGTERGIFFFVAVQCVDGTRVEGGKPAARIVIVHLDLDGLDGGGGGLGIHAQRQDGGVALGFLPPVGIGGGGGEKLVHLGLACLLYTSPSPRD